MRPEADRPVYGPWRWQHHYAAGIWAPPALAQADCNPLDQASNKWPERDYLIFEGRRWTYSEAAAISSNLASDLREKLGPLAKRLALVLPNHPALIFYAYAAWRAGLAICLVNPVYPPNQLRAMLELVEADAAVVLGDSGLSEVLEMSCPVINANPDCCELDHARGDSLNNGWIDSSLDDEAVIAFSGGTSGAPKGVSITHRALTSAAAQMHHFFDALKPGSETFLAALPLTHIGGFQNTVNLPTRIGATIVLMAKFEASSALSLIIEHHVSHLVAVPTMLSAISEMTALDGIRPASLKYAMAGGAPMPDMAREAVEAILGVPIRSGYGMTEASGTIASNMPQAKGAANSTGVPFPGVELEIRELGRDGLACPIGEVGEVWVSGPMCMQGYVGNETATNDMIIAGWMRTGDIGSMNTDGFLTLLDRAKNLIISGGYNIYPARVEAALEQIATVEKACVFGIPDDRLGEIAVATIICRNGLSPSADVLISELGKTLARYEIPRAFCRFKGFPMTPIGKVDRLAIADQFGHAERLS